MKLREDVPQLNWLCRTLPGNIILGELLGGVSSFFGFIALASRNVGLSFSVVAGTIIFCAIVGCILGIILWLAVTRRLSRKSIKDGSGKTTAIM